MIIRHGVQELSNAFYTLVKVNFKVVIKYSFSILLCLLLLRPSNMIAQLSLSDIQLEKIEQRSVRKYVKRQLKQGGNKIESVKASWNDGDDLSEYYKDVMTFEVNNSLMQVWGNYVSTDPSTLWNNRKSTKGLMLQKSPDKIYYEEDCIEQTATGQIYYLNLKMLLGLLNMAVAFEIISIDHTERLIAFSYVEGNKSLGVQQIKFYPLDDHSTKIIHTSYFKSGKRFRDRRLYPFFHKKLTRDFHENVNNILQEESSIKG